MSVLRTLWSFVYQGNYAHLASVGSGLLWASAFPEFYWIQRAKSRVCHSHIQGHKRQSQKHFSFSSLFFSSLFHHYSFLKRAKNIVVSGIIREQGSQLHIINLSPNIPNSPKSSTSSSALSVLSKSLMHPKLASNLLCTQAWPWIHDPLNYNSKCWDYMYVPLCLDYAVLEITARASDMLGKHTTELHP